MDTLAPIMAFSVAEDELRGMDTSALVGHLAAWNYFMSLKNPDNDSFTKKWAAYAKAKKLPGADVSIARHQAGGMTMSIDPALDIPRPQHQIEE